MKPLRSLSVAALLTTGCLGTDPASHALVTRTEITVAVPPSANAPPALAEPSPPYVALITPQPGVQPTPPAPPPIAVREIPNMLRGDIYAIPDGTDHLPDFSLLQRLGSIVVPDINIPPRDFTTGFPGVTDRIEWFAIRYTGVLQAPLTGIYHFRVISDDGARLLLDGVPVLTNDGTHPPTSAESNVYITGGTHHVVLEYYQGPRVQIALQLFWRGPNFPERIFGAAPVVQQFPSGVGYGLGG